MTSPESPGRNRHRPHVLQFICSFDQGGSERLACDLARGLVPRGYDVSMCALDDGGLFEDELAALGIPTHVAWRKPGRDWRLPFALVRHIRERRADVVVTHHLNQLIYAGLPARLAGARLVHVEHETFTLEPEKARRRLRLLAPVCHAIVGVAEAVGDFLRAEIPAARERILVIPNGVDLERYQVVSTAPKRRFGMAAGERWVGYVGRLVPAKDTPTLLRAFAIVAVEMPSARLAIVGDGVLRDSLVALASELGQGERVFFLGRRPDVADLLPHLELFVLSSVNEGLPLAVLEAMACARPVVATAIGELPAILGDGERGRVVQPGDPRALASAMLEILADPVSASAMGRAGRRLVEQKYSLAATVDAYAALIDRVLGRTPRERR